MKAANTLSPVKKKEKVSFSAVITEEKTQNLIRASLRDEKAVRRFTGTLISVVNASEQLRNCDAGTIISCALRGEGMGLTYGHGYYVVPYGQSATFITGFKGYIQLALATGLYADIDCIDVREGERKGRDKRTGKPVIDMSVYDTDEERDSHPVIGYKAYFELKDGYYREEYWTVDELLRHADRYSKAFSLDTYRKWQRGEPLTANEQRSVDNGPWYTSTDRMMRKTVLRSLLNSGFAPLSNELKSLFDKEPESGDGVIPDFGGDVIPDYPAIDETTGEVIDVDYTSDTAGNAPESPESVSVSQTGMDTAEEPKQRQDARSKATEPVTAMDYDTDSFFGGLG